jgi:hypothetical protein
MLKVEIYCDASRPARDIGAAEPCVARNAFRAATERVIRYETGP